MNKTEPETEHLCRAQQPAPDGVVLSCRGPASSTSSSSCGTIQTTAPRRAARRVDRTGRLVWVGDSVELCERVSGWGVLRFVDC